MRFILEAFGKDERRSLISDQDVLVLRTQLLMSPLSAQLQRGCQALDGSLLSLLLKMLNQNLSAEAGQCINRSVYHAFIIDSICLSS